MTIYAKFACTGHGQYKLAGQTGSNCCSSTQERLLCPQSSDSLQRRPLAEAEQLLKSSGLLLHLPNVTLPAFHLPLIVMLMALLCISEQKELKLVRNTELALHAYT